MPWRVSGSGTSHYCHIARVNLREWIPNGRKSRFFAHVLFSFTLICILLFQQQRQRSSINWFEPGQSQLPRVPFTLPYRNQSPTTLAILYCFPECMKGKFIWNLTTRNWYSIGYGHPQRQHKLLHICPLCTALYNEIFKKQIFFLFRFLLFIWLAA